VPSPQFRTFTGWLALLACVPGCAGPGAPGLPKWPGATGQSVAGSPAAAPRGGPSRRESSEGSGVALAGSLSPSDNLQLSRTAVGRPPVGGHALTARLKGAASAVSSALTISPKVVPPNDPISLASDPGPLGSEVFVSAAVLYEQQGKFAEAAAQYQKALERDPRSRVALIGYGRLLHREGKLEEAIGTYRRALTVRGHDAVVLNDLGLCHARRGEMQLAVQALSAAVQLDPQSALYRNNIATTLVEMGQADDALHHLRAVHDPAGAHYNLGYLLLRRGETTLAADHFRLALRENPAMPQAAQMLAHLDRQPHPDGQISGGVALRPRDTVHDGWRGDQVPNYPTRPASAVAPQPDPTGRLLTAPLPEHGPAANRHIWAE